jgi:peptide/nickel transport system substrate-binding protein
MRTFAACAAIILFSIISCAPEEEGFVGEQGGTLTGGTTEIITVLSPLEPSAFGSNDVLDLLFMRLHRYDPSTDKMKPELAASWEFSEDLKSITYYLRDDVTWWDGVPVTAEDVYYTYTMMIAPETEYPDIARVRFIDTVEVLGTYAIRFSFSRVYADVLTDSDIMPVPRHIHEQSPGTFGQNPVGNGPYTIEEWVPGSRLVLGVNEAYYRGRPPLDEIEIRYYPDPTALSNAFTHGQLDIIFNITPAVAQRLSADENTVLDRRPGNTYTYVGWNLRHEHLADPEIRRALSLAINARGMLDTIFSGMGTVSNGPLPPSSWGYSSDVVALSHDVVAAREILRSKGFADRNQNGILDKNGKDFVLTIITNSESSDRVALLNAVARDLGELGILVRARTLRTDRFIRAIIGRDFDGFVMGWSVGEKIDPTVYWYSDKTKGIYNFVSYENKSVDSLIDQGVAMLNRKKAKELWHAFQKIVYEDLPYTFLVVPDKISASHAYVRGIDRGLALGNAYAYWIPESEREAMAGVPPAVVEEIVTTPAQLQTEEQESEVQPVVRPEEVLEAAARRETTAIASVQPESITAMTPPPKPSITTRATPIRRVTPKYPEAARAIGASGRVVIRVLVGADGKVKETTILSSFGNPACEAAALAAAKQWEFDPATKDGVPFEQMATIPFDFRP